MVNKINKNNFEKIFFNQKFLTLIGLVAIILISFPFVKNSIKQYQINREINDFKKEISDLQNKNVDLKNFISYLESDQFAEEQARLNLNLKKPGEELAVIKNDTSGLGSGTTTKNSIFNIPGYKKTESKRILSNPEKWLNYFFK
jgi:cell division protein FtsL